MSADENITAALVRTGPAATLAVRKMPLQARTDRLVRMAGPRIRYQLMRVGPVGMSGAAALLASGIAAVAFLLPAHRDVVALRAELAQGRAPAAVREPTQTPNQFAASLPTRAEVPALLGLVLEQAKAAGIELDQGKYVYVAPTANRLAKYNLEFPVKGDYTSIRAFIDKSLKAMPALGLDKLQIERKNIGEGAVSANVGFIVYLRGS